MNLRPLALPSSPGAAVRLRALVAPAVCALVAALATPALADWTERVGSGGIASGRYRHCNVPTATKYALTFERGTTHVNGFTDHSAADGMRTYSSKDYGGTNGDLYVGLNCYGTNVVDVGQKESGVTNSRAVAVHEDYSGGGRTQIDIGSAVRGSALGYTHDVVTLSGVSRWFLATTQWSGPGELRWYGSANYPTTGGASTNVVAFASDTVLGEGCVADDGTATAYGVALSSASGAVRFATLSTSGGSGPFEHTPTSWTSAHDRQVGQCFMIGAKFVGIVYNADRDETFVGITDDQVSLDTTQTLSGEWVGGVTYDGVGYIADTGSPFSVYTSDGTGAFSDLSDDLPSAPVLLTLTPEADGVEAWLAAASIYERTEGSESTALRNTMPAGFRPSGFGFAPSRGQL